MMRLSLSGRNDFIAYLGGKGDIHKCIAMKVTDLAAADPKFGPAKTMRMPLHVFPR